MMLNSSCKYNIKVCDASAAVYHRQSLPSAIAQCSQIARFWTAVHVMPMLAVELQEVRMPACTWTFESISQHAKLCMQKYAQSTALHLQSGSPGASLP